MPNAGQFGSVFDWQAGNYRVYQLPQAAAIMSDTRVCSPATSPTRIGVDVGMAICPLPSGSRFVQTSDRAVGSVMRESGGGIHGLGGGFGLFGLGMLGAIGEAVALGVAVQLATPHVAKFVGNMLGLGEKRRRRRRR